MVDHRKKLLDYIDKKKASEFTFKIEKININAPTRVLKANWSIELDHELRQWLAEDLEREKEDDGYGETEAFELH